MVGQLQRARFELLSGEARKLARLATIAELDVINGGARAAVIAAKYPSACGGQYGDVVSAAYTDSRGQAHEYLAFECPECGSACLGKSAALACCSSDDWLAPNLDASEELD